MNEHAPGWYEHDGERRYWDGTRWTHSTSLPSAPAVPVQGYVPPPAGPYAAPYPGAPPVARKEPAISVLVSFFVPGVGSMINGDVGTGVGFLCAYVLGLVLIACLGWLVVGLIGLPLCLGVWIWSMIHAYQGAVEHNVAIGYPG